MFPIDDASSGGHVRSHHKSTNKTGSGRNRRNLGLEQATRNLLVTHIFKIKNCATKPCRFWHSFDLSNLPKLPQNRYIERFDWCTAEIFR